MLSSLLLGIFPEEIVVGGICTQSERCNVSSATIEAVAEGRELQHCDDG